MGMMEEIVGKDIYAAIENMRDIAEKDIHLVKNRLAFGLFKETYNKERFLELESQLNAKNKNYVVTEEYELDELLNLYTQYYNQKSEKLWVQDLVDLSPIAEFTNLKELTIGDNDGYASLITDLSPIKKLTNLEKFYIRGTKINDISAIKNLTNLVELDLDHMSIMDLNALEYLKNLRKLSLSDLKRADDKAYPSCPPGISSVTTLKNLERLYINDIVILDLPQVRNLTNLTYLCLGSCSIKDIPLLTSLTNLKELHLLNLHGYINENKAPCLENLKKIKKLTFNGRNLYDVSAIGNLESLEELDLNGTGIWDISVLSNLTGLHKLSLHDCLKLRDISPLKSLINLKELDVSLTEITDISALSNLRHLEVLDISNTQVADLTPLQRLPKLKELNIKNWKDDAYSVRLRIQPIRMKKGLKIIGAENIELPAQSIKCPPPKKEGFYEENNKILT
jgi:internalin A